MKQSKKVLIDCDPGIDDALAILFALASGRLKVDAITTVYGNVSVKRCTNNLINILRISGLKTLPEIGMGSIKPLAGKRLKTRAVHGRDGLGEINLKRPKMDFDIKDAVELACTNILSKKVDHIIATGPLTNIAKIIKRDSKVSNLLKRIYIMGGTVFVKGSITPYAEFNIYNDPEAAKTVFDSKIPKILVGLDVTQKVILESRDLLKFRRKNDRLSRFIVHIADYSIEYHKNLRHIKGAYMHDPLCVGVAIDEDICEYNEGRLDVELRGRRRGKIIRRKGRPDILYCKNVKVEKFKKLFLDSLEKLCREAAN